jgi:uncharacterized protein YbjT (DUF2867 family)
MSQASDRSSASDDVQSTGLLVTGATGMIGGLVVDALVDRGVPLTVMLRPSSDAGRFADRPGVGVVRGDFDDPASLERTLHGIERAFLVTNSTERTQGQQTAFVEAAQAAGVRHLVKLSQLHASADSPVRFLRYHAAVESAIEQSGVPYTFVRPNLILQAYLPFAPMIAAGVLQAPIDDARVSVVDARDIAAVAAAALTRAGHEGRTYDVTGPEALSHAEIASAFGDAAGHDVRFEPVSPDDFVATLEKSGMPAWQAEGLAEDYAHYQRGEAAGVSPDVEQVTGRAPRSVQRFAADHADAFRRG